ncbi:MAG TPA: hypothetical protein PK530_06065 [Anaerolineales bacterium]|nr:hypothetical protein [Anaerolineales bacterium]
MAKKDSPLQYPWASLYDIESGVRKLNLGTSSGRAGRPPKAINRLHTSITLTDEEKRLYEKLTYVIGSKLHPNTVTKSQVLGLALRLLDVQVEKLPKTADSWETLARYLFQENEEA